MDKIEKDLLEAVSGLHEIPAGAYNIRANGVSVGRASSENIEIVSKTDKPGIDIIIKPGTKNESVHIPVILSESGLNDMVYNDFYIGEGADVVIVAGCGIHNGGDKESRHDGIHSFFVGKNAKVKYIEKHFAEGDGNGVRVMNPTTIVDIAENGYMEMNTMQIKGVDSTKRKTKQIAETDFTVDMNGENSSAHVVSRSVAKENSKQIFLANVRGNTKCSGHTECDAIIMDNAVVSAIPEITANSTEAALIHEAAIGKIADEQIEKLMTLGLSEKEAEEQIISGFLK